MPRRHAASSAASSWQLAPWMLYEFTNSVKRLRGRTCPNTLLHDHAREQRTVRQTRDAPTARLFVSAARVQIGDVNLPKAAMDSPPVSMTWARERVGWGEY